MKQTILTIALTAVCSLSQAQISYYFSSEKGTIQFIGYTSQNLLSKYQKTIEDLLNGLVQY
jgi:predicted transcriptional regulator